MSRLDDIQEAARRETQQAQSSATILQGPGPKYVQKAPYIAWGAPTPDPQIRLIVYAKKHCMMPQYSVLYDVFFGGAGEFIGLIYPQHSVKIYGRNLIDLVYSLRTNSVEWIREYIPFYHELPEDPDGTLPVIEEIDVDGVKNPFQVDMSGQRQK